MKYELGEAGEPVGHVRGEIRFSSHVNSAIRNSSPTTRRKSPSVYRSLANLVLEAETRFILTRMPARASPYRL
jgi:hypothetical protein